MRRDAWRAGVDPARMNTGEVDGVGDSNESCREELASAASRQTVPPRRPTDEEGTDVIAQEARELIERMRVELSQLRGSVDLRENTERLMSLRAARHLMAYKRRSDAENQQPENVSEPQRIAQNEFFFVPMATAPMTRLTVCSHQEKGARQKRFKQQRFDAGPSQDSPPWNSSTSLQKSDKTTAKKVPGSTVSVRDCPLAPTKGIASTAHTLAEFNRVSNCLERTSEEEVDDLTDKKGVVSRVDEIWVRDYLRRLNIVTRGPTESEGRIDDPVLNGVALHHLVSIALNRDLKEGRATHPAIVLKPQNLDDVRLNYVVALNLLRAAENDATLQIPRECRLIRPESVILRGDSVALFTLMRTVIDAYLPTACEELWAAPSLTWQPHPDGGGYTPSAMRSLELEVCAFLQSQNVLADPVVHQLPPDDAPVPDALSAPFLAPQRKLWCMRNEGFPSLYIPSVFPFFTNGTALCDLVGRVTGNRLSVYRNPRVKSNCMENIQAAFTVLHRYCPTKMSPFFIESPECVFYGDRRYILLLLEDIMRMAHGVPPRRHAPRSTDTPHFERQRSSQVPHTLTVGVTQSSSSASMPEVQKQQRLGELASKLFEKNPGKEEGLRDPDRATPRCVIASPLSERRRAGRPTQAKQVPFSSAPLVETNITLGALDTPVAVLNGVEYMDDEVTTMQKWLIEVLGPGFHYTAADHSFSVSSRDLQLGGTSLIFSDGVVLAHMIRLLERRRCVELESIEMHAKATAAKRRNIRKCVLFLQTEKRALLNVPLLDEILLAGDRLGVLYVVQCLRNTYRFAVRV
ncbi:hypothetical protein TcBrA4_0003410 [Trypanosoma cruzi]|nr:hypothetical protein TcBrA4_0003410 [Trypanosoma cruzi]